jgi:TfoX/Sxy family transcriptional regulator of competence genes
VATDASFVDYVQEQSGLGEALSYRKMFGEYSFYLYGKVIGLACDNQLFLKPTDEGRRLLVVPTEHPPFPGCKPYLRIDAETEDRDLLRRLLVATADALPLPKPKPKAKPKDAAKVATRPGTTSEGKKPTAKKKATAKPRATGSADDHGPR